MAKRFLEDHRRPVANYDRIHFDEQEIADLRARLDLETPLRVHWNWDYITEIESLRALYEKGKTKQWNVEADVDWSLPVDDFVMPQSDSSLGQILQLLGRDEAEQKAAVRDELEWALSQLLHGEQAALQLCAQLVNAIPDMDAKLFAGQQVADECRHVEMFAKLISRKFGHVHPISPNVKFLLDEMLAANDWHKKMIGMQVLFEGVAMAIITDIGKRTNSELIRESMRLVARDEARHAAFGALALREELDDLSQERHDELEDWTWMCLEVVANGLMSGMFDIVGPKYDLDPDAIAQMVFSSEGFWDGRYHMFNHTVMPNLKKLGVITERTRSNYDRFRLMDKTAPHGTEPIAHEEFYGEV
jgi:hypothetical protein